MNTDLKELHAWQDKVVRSEPVQRVRASWTRIFIAQGCITAILELIRWTWGFYSNG